MSNIPVGTIIHNIEMKPGLGGQIARAAGTYAQLIGKDAGFAQLRLNSTDATSRCIMSPIKTAASVGCPSKGNYSEPLLAL